MTWIRVISGLKQVHKMMHDASTEILFPGRTAQVVFIGLWYWTKAETSMVLRKNFRRWKSLVNQRRSINWGGIFLVFFLLQWPSWHPSQVWWAPVATEEGCYSLFSVAERQLRRDVKRFICTSKACYSTWQRFTAWAENECSHEKQKTFQWFTIAKMMKFVHIVSFRMG